ncbi:hypothetical protein MMPV_003200 [Pyropia vietnamensis]
MVRPSSPRRRDVQTAGPVVSIVRRCVSGLAALRLWQRLPSQDVEKCAGAGAYRALYAPEEDSEDLLDGAMISVEGSGGGGGGGGGVYDGKDAISSVSSASSADGGGGSRDRRPTKPRPAGHNAPVFPRRRPRRSSVADTRRADEPLIRTRGVTCNPPGPTDAASSFVRRGDAFIVRILGVVASPHDWHISRKNNRFAGRNELVVWSERGDSARRRSRAARRKARIAAGLPVVSSPSSPSAAAISAVATSSAGADAAGVSTIHFDFAERGGYASRPGDFVPVPASRSVAVRELGCGPPLRLAGWASPLESSAAIDVGGSRGASGARPWIADLAASAIDEDDAPASINLRINVAEIDDASSVLSSLSSALTLSGHASANIGSSGAGYIAEAVGGAEAAQGLLDAAHGAGRLAQMAIERAARLDMVLSVDQDFRLLPRTTNQAARLHEFSSASPSCSHVEDEPERTAEQEWQARRFVPASPGRSEYLRYGTFFFLSRAVPERLYARLDDRRNVALCTRTPPPVSPDGRVGLATYTALKGVSYVVVRVEQLGKLEAAIAEARSPSPHSLSPSSQGWKQRTADQHRIAAIRR